MVSAAVRRGLVAGSVLVVSAVLAAQQVRLAPEQSGPPSGPKPTGFVLGTVVDATTGAPIAGASLSVTYFGPVTTAVSPPLAPMPKSDAPRQVLTDAQGRFVLRELPAGMLNLSASAPGYTSGGYLQTKPGAATHFLELEEGARRGDVQIRLWKLGSISGTVLDEAGEPAVGALVRVMTRQMSGGRLGWLSRGTTATDDRGVYRVSGLSPGQYLIGIVTTRSTLPVEMASANAAASGQTADDLSRQAMMALVARPTAAISDGARVGDVVLDLSPGRNGYTLLPPDSDGAMQVYASIFYPSAPTAAQATPIALKAGEERTGINLSLSLTAAVRVSGTVTGPAGPARNVNIRLMPQSADDLWQESTFETATAATDPNGAFTFFGVPSGQYILKTEVVPRAAPGEAPVATPFGTPSPAPELTWARVPITVGTTAVSGVSVTLARGIVISGRVAFEGTASKPAAQQLTNISVMVQPLGPRLAVLPSLGGRVTTDGMFTTVGVPAGAYYAVTTEPRGWMLRSVDYNGRNIAAEPLTLEGGDITGVVVTFTDKVTSLAGSVADASGAPDTNADVIVFPADSDTWKQGAFNSWRTKLSGTTKSAKFEFSTLPPGDYFVAAVSTTLTDAWQDPKFLTRLQSVATRISVAEGDKKTIALRTTVPR